MELKNILHIFIGPESDHCFASEESTSMNKMFEFEQSPPCGLICSQCNRLNNLLLQNRLSNLQQKHSTLGSVVSFAAFFNCCNYIFRQQQVSCIHVVTLSLFPHQLKRVNLLTMLGKLSSEPRGIQKVFTNDLFFRRSRRLARYVKKILKLEKKMQFAQMQRRQMCWTFV